jgi:nicotinamidase-related amidase
MLNSSKPTLGVISAEPEPIELDWSATALVIIDMQRDFMEPGGFGETLGNDVSQLARAVKPIGAVLKAARDTGMLVIHTREGHLPDLSDAPPAKVERGAPSLRIGDPARWAAFSFAVRPATTSSRSSIRSTARS